MSTTQQENKYIVTKTAKVINNQTLYQIKAAKTFRCQGKVIEEGALGGYLHSELCLSQTGDCWIDADSTVQNGCGVHGEALILKSNLRDDSEVSGSARVENSTLSGGARVYDGACVFYSAIMGNCYVFGDALVKKCIIAGGSSICGHALIEESVIGLNSVVFVGGCSTVKHARIEGNVMVTGSAKIRPNDFSFGGRLFVNINGKNEKEPVILDLPTIYAFSMDGAPFTIRFPAKMLWPLQSTDIFVLYDKNEKMFYIDGEGLTEEKLSNHQGVSKLNAAIENLKKIVEL